MFLLNGTDCDFDRYCGGDSRSGRLANDRKNLLFFRANEQRFLSWVFMEIFGGGSTRIIQKILGDSVEDARYLEAKIQLQCELNQSLMCLTAAEWRVMYESVNAVTYGLGPSELHTCTGHNLQEVCIINLKICAVLWEACGVGRIWVAS